ncbi:MAG: hypothetical protein Q7J16_01850 [Candidatus Cloacimonadales bacterium]|nr:hypothetical protein [Candidatus Cloacimonadales bacterium]
MKCIEIFGAVQYRPFIEKILFELNKNEILEKKYKIAFSNVNGMYELVERDNVIDLNSNNIIQDFLKVNPERIEIKKTIHDESSFEKSITIFQNLYNLHKTLFSNKAVKFGLVKLYTFEKLEESINPFSFKVNIDNLDNGKTFLLLKEDGFNINIEYTSQKGKLVLKVDINDIVVPNSYYEWNHIKKINELHDIVINENIPEIFGS